MSSETICVATMLSAATLIAGFILLIFGGELLVRGAVKLAKRLNVSPLLIGLAIVGFGTSMPELVASLQAVFAGAPGIAWGNIAGSNLANSLLILGTAALLAPFAVKGKEISRDTAAALAATALLYGFAFLQWDGWIAGPVLLGCLVGYLVFAYFEEVQQSEARGHGAAYDRASARKGEAAFESKHKGGWAIPIALTVAGLVLMVIGGRFLVSGAVDIARLLGLSEPVIGLTVVAIGTSAPELIASSVAALRKQGELAFGNIVGSNIYNLFGIGGATAIAAPGSIPAGFLTVEFPLLLGVAILLMALVLMGGRFGRITGALLLGGYIVYLSLLLAGAAT